MDRENWAIRVRINRLTNHKPEHKARVVDLARRGVPVAWIVKALQGLAGHSTIEGWVMEDRLKGGKTDQRH